jgi:diadenosine tetraphosphate (Ap4A) HIT family hydrolase
MTPHLITHRAAHQNPCEICDKIERAKRGELPNFICETPNGIAILGEVQKFRGYSVLLCKHPVTELEELPRETKLAFLEEMSLLAQAVQTVTNCYKINYEALGNMVHHFHWHVFPRYQSDEYPLQPVWNHIPQSNDAVPFLFNSDRDAQLLHDIRHELQKLLSEN